MNTNTRQRPILFLCHNDTRIVLALPKDHPLTVHSQISLSALEQERFLLFPQHVYPSLHQEIMTACARAGFRPHVVQELDSAQSALSLVGAGMGITFAGASPDGQPPPGVFYRGLEDLPIRLELSIAWRRNNVSPVLAEFVELARTLF